jgi:hypothetical protein
MMDMQQRRNFLAGLYRLQGDLFSLQYQCIEANDLNAGVPIEKCLREINQLVEKLKPLQFNDPRSDEWRYKNEFGIVKREGLGGFQ